MKKLLFIFSVATILSCNSISDNAISYNNTLLEHQQTIASKMESYLGRLKDTLYNDHLDAFKETILIDIKKSDSILNVLEDFNGNSSFKESAISVLNAYAYGINYEYEAIADYQRLPFSQKTSQKRLEAEQHAIHADEKITKAEDNFILKQQVFAKENNFSLD